MSVVHEDILMRAVEALGRALAGVMLQQRMGVQLPGRRDEQDLDEWLRTLDESQLARLPIEDVLKAAKIRTRKQLDKLIEAVNPADLRATDPIRSARRTALVARLKAARPYFRAL